MKFLTCLLIVILLHGSNAWADCKSDCQDEYDSEVQSCKSLYDDPDDADDLGICLDNAKIGYDLCVTECEN